MKNKILLIIPLSFIMILAFIVNGVNFKSLTSEKTNNEEIENISNQPETVQSTSKPYIEKTENASSETKNEQDTITEDTKKDLCDKDCETQEPVCTYDCEIENLPVEPVCPTDECSVYMPICNEEVCQEEVIESQTLYIPNNVDECIDQFYEIDLAGESMIIFESEDEIMTTYRGLCNELINFKPVTYDEFINNRPEGFPPMPIKVNQLGEYLFNTYVILYEEVI